MYFHGCLNSIAPLVLLSFRSDQKNISKVFLSNKQKMETSTFCPNGETIWDYQSLWNTNSPRFSRCFLSTVPPLVPSLFLWALTPFEVYFNWYRRLKDLSLPVRPIPYNLYNVSRLVAVLVVVGVALVQFTYQLLTLFYCDGGELGGDYQRKQIFLSKQSFSDFWYSLSTACTFVSSEIFFI